MKKLLFHQDAKIASAAAHGEWYANHQKRCRTSLISEWRSAVVRSRDDYFVSTVLPGDSDLSFNWIINFLHEENPEIYKYERAIQAAVSALDKESKIHLLDILPVRWKYHDLIFGLIGDDIDLYRLLLQNERLKDYHTIPLKWQDGDSWIDKVKLAMEKGYSAKEIAYTACGYTLGEISWVGNESNVWKEWVERFTKLCLHEEKSIREVGAAGKVSQRQN